MSCLCYQPWSVLLVSVIGPGSRDAYRIAVQFKSASNFAVCRVQQGRVPQLPAVPAGPIIKPAETSPFFSRESQAQYQAFVRFAVTSSAALSAIALKLDLPFGTF